MLTDKRWLAAEIPSAQTTEPLRFEITSKSLKEKGGRHWRETLEARSVARSREPRGRVKSGECRLVVAHKDLLPIGLIECLGHRADS